MNTKKCIVLDLDNTLWGGVVGEDGITGIKLSTAGESSGFVAFQQALLDLYHRGVILAVNSQNNFNDGIEVIRKHPNMVLKEHHFAALRINWDNKAANLVELAKEINIGLDSMVFLDDEPAQRDLVRHMLPEVTVPDLPKDPAKYTKFLMGLPYFPTSALTDEDALRGNLYTTERLRKESEKSFGTRESFLKDLGLEVHVFKDNDTCLPRLAQLTEKTNQFNINKQPLTEQDIAAFMRDPNYSVIHARVIDRFGDYGVTNVAIVQHKPWQITAFLMSCRVIGRGVEEAILSRITEDAKQSGAESLLITFVKTDKNKPAEDFVTTFFPMGSLSLKTPIQSPSWITVTHGYIQ